MAPGWAFPGHFYRTRRQAAAEKKDNCRRFSAKGDSGLYCAKAVACLLCVKTRGHHLRTIERSIFLAEKLKIIPLGGLDEIGKNITVLEYGKDMIVVDCGVGFP